jgi:hypothetical protein
MSAPRRATFARAKARAGGSKKVQTTAPAPARYAEPAWPKASTLKFLEKPISPAGK